mgnify:CR=1 FL=1
MRETVIRTWKKVFEPDLSYIAYELREIVETPALVILEGPLGAGKTSFVKCFVDGDEAAMSPSYSLLNEVKDILHGDFYRIKDREEVIHLEIPLYLENKNFFLVEWGKKHIDSIIRELPEDFSLYQLNVDINNIESFEENTEELESRNYTLMALKEY